MHYHIVMNYNGLQLTYLLLVLQHFSLSVILQPCTFLSIRLIQSDSSLRSLIIPDVLTKSCGRKWCLSVSALEENGGYNCARCLVNLKLWFTNQQLNIWYFALLHCRSKAIQCTVTVQCKDVVFFFKSSSVERIKHYHICQLADFF